MTRRHTCPHWSHSSESALPTPWSSSRYPEDEFANGIDLGLDRSWNSAHWRHFGRLAGYTNLKEKHRQEDGKQAYVLLHEWSGQVAVQAAPLLQAAQERAQLRTQPQPPQQSGPATPRQLGVEGKPVPSPVTVGSPLGQEYGRRMKRLLQR